jgi:hypothetical protein
LARDVVISGNYRNTSFNILRAHGIRAELLVSSSRSPPRARGDNQQMRDLRGKTVSLSAE